MKKTVFIVVFFATFISCKKQQEDFGTKKETVEVATLEKGEALFNENNCTACHQLNQKVVGPSLQDIAKIYKEKNGNIVSFLKEEAQPIVDPSQYETMKINLQVTKNMSDSDLKSLEIYMLNQSK